ncbi:glyoxalase/bleomycin resistance protein/dioxygenase superfamily protein [Halalkalicoccus paucihalophilus]|uniref:Glyoxalase/bleomycin resistance protein/dioxygenase superfamily protein n=1 Tax=Halalkalicoccus paucihalophilus TaxID=1008153 RepID=A0A151AHV8_9EURY|nr:VOC family protein [Halalkalicoccus paucihalophilus]KYH27090.1 glyoxalase/bleomycin resistance protein/dioxygenase superfamily protein [Halalkalicoccus paucihalophilus]
MLSDATGLHHVTALAGDSGENADFYVGELGLRFLRRTVNHEDRFAYHLYYGDARGTPGSVLTFFPYPHGDPGRIGRPQPSAVALSVPEGSLDYWVDRLAAHDPERTDRFGERVLRVADPDGTRIELVASDLEGEPWTERVPENAAIRGIGGVTLWPTNPYGTAATLETFGFEAVGQEGDRIRYRSPSERTRIDLLDRGGEFGREGPGTIHHVALRIESEAELFEWHDLFRERKYHVSRVRDRHYFRSLYVRDAGGILFELATEPEGLAADGGEQLTLPPWFEEDRELIESQLPPLAVPPLAHSR